MELSESAAQDLGRAFRFLRQALQLTLHEAAARSQVSAPYIQNIETGGRRNVSRDVYEALGRAYRVDPSVVRDLLLKAEIVSALERRGLAAVDREAVWSGTVSAAAARGVRITTDLAGVIASIITSVRPPAGIHDPSSMEGPLPSDRAERPTRKSRSA